MTIKKILAGVLAAASVMTMSATAFAVEAPDKTKAVTKPGETEFSLDVTPMNAELDVELPGTMKAFLNPYAATVAIDAATTPTEISSGVVSWAYEVVNNTKDFGIMIDANAVTTVSTPDTTAWTVTPAVVAGTKKVQMGLIGADDVATIKAEAAKTLIGGAASSSFKTASAKYTSAAKMGILMMDSTQAVNTTNGTPAGYTEQDGLLYVKAATASGAAKGYLAVIVDLAPSSTTKVTWNEDDTISTTIVLKINPAGKDATIT